MKDGSENLSKYAWNRDKVGIWYGGWSADDWYKSLKNPHRQFQYLANLPQPKGRGRLRETDINTAKRFASIKKNDWVVVFFDDSLHLAQICGDFKSSSRHSNLNRNGEIFKFRKIVRKKSFPLGSLPDSYRLIPPAGLGNVHQFGETGRKLITYLAENKNEKFAIKTISAIPFMEWLDLLGPAEWESFCLGYLILTEGFVPTGLVVGRTLPTFDIIGRNKHGVRVIAQCKKDPKPLQIPPDFINACKGMKEKARVYFFAYGGITGDPKLVPKWITVFNRENVQQWVNAGAGKKYAAMWHQVN